MLSLLNACTDVAVRGLVWYPSELKVKWSPFVWQASLAIICFTVGLFIFAPFHLSLITARPFCYVVQYFAQWFRGLYCAKTVYIVLRSFGAFQSCGHFGINIYICVP
jgi:hypothetical protein